MPRVSVPEARRDEGIPGAIRNGALFSVADPLGFLSIVPETVECPVCHRAAALLHLSQSEDRMRLGLPAWQWCCLRCVGIGWMGAAFRGIRS